MVNDEVYKGQPKTFDAIKYNNTFYLNTLIANKLEFPVITFWRLQVVYTLETDVYDEQNGCVLPQKQPDATDRPIGYWSH